MLFSPIRVANYVDQLYIYEQFCHAFYSELITLMTIILSTDHSQLNLLKLESPHNRSLSHRVPAWSHERSAAVPSLEGTVNQTLPSPTPLM